MSTVPERSSTAAILVELFGDAVLEVFRDPTVTELYVNPDGRVWCVRAGMGRCPTGLDIDAQRIRQIINTVAASLDESVNRHQPSLRAELPIEVFNQARMQAEIPPVVSAPSFNLRKPPTEIYSLASYVETGALRSDWLAILQHAVQEHWNILVCGPTHSGKTTFCNAMIREMTEQFPQERFVVIEDTREIQCAAADVLAFRTDPGSAITMAELVRATLRRDPDRIIVGEVRGVEALDMIDAWSTGHPGIGTVHASSPEKALRRIDRLCQRANVPSQMPMIADNVDLIIMIAPTREGRRITEVAKVCGLDGDGQPVIKSLAAESR